MKRIGKKLLGVFLVLACLLTMLSGCTPRKPEVMKSEGDGVTVELRDVIYKDEILSGTLHLTFTSEVAKEIAESGDPSKYLQDKYIPVIDYNDHQVNLRVGGVAVAQSGGEVLYADMSFDEQMHQPKVTRNMEVLIILHNVPPLRLYLT